MLDKTFKVIFPLSLIIQTVTAFLPDGILSFFVPYSMVILSLCIYSLGWILSSYSENPYSKEYDLARHLALAAVVSVPLLALVFTPSFLYPYIVGKGFVFRFLAIIAGVSALYLSLTNENFRIKLTPFFNASLIFTVVIGISTLLSMDPSRSFFSNFERMEGYINVLLIFSLVAAVTIIRLKESEWITVFKTHVWVSGIIGTVAVLQFFIGILSLKGFAQLPILNLCLSTGSGCRVDATLGNSIYLGLYCGLSFWLIIYAIFVRRMNSYLLMSLAGIQLLAVYFSGTRGVWVGMFLGLVTLFISKFWFDGKRKQAYMSLLAGALFVVCLGGFIFYANQNGLYQDVGLVKRFSSMNTLFARWTIWKMALVSWTEQPLFGWGKKILFMLSIKIMIRLCMDKKHTLIIRTIHT